MPVFHQPIRIEQQQCSIAQFGGTKIPREFEKDLNEIVKWSLQCNSFCMATADTLKAFQALSKTGHSVVNSMGYFIEIMFIHDQGFTVY